jgi:hypothetical protein
MTNFWESIQNMALKDMDLMSFVILIMLVSFIVMFWRASIQGRINWVDLIRKPGGKTVSLTKLIQLLGAMVATWIMVKMAMSDKITWDLLATYLAYVGSVEGYSKFVSAKYGADQPTKKDKTKSADE